MLDADESVAVIGLAAKVPGARDVEEYWLNLVRGRESVTVLTDEELRDRGVPEELLADPAYVKAAAMVPDAEYADAQLFKMTTREAETCDPQIRLFLEVAHTAIENAGYDPATLDAGVGVFASAGPPFYAEQNLLPHPEIADSPVSAVMSLNHGGYIATMTSYKLDLRGPSMTVQTACSSTLVALHLACQSLRVGDCDVAVVGGADVEFPLGHGYLWTPGGVLSRDGHCRPFDAEAGGTVFGGGACAVVVKRLADALADHDHISAVIRGTALNNDGADKVSFGAPSTSGQTAVVMEAMALAGVRPEEISYVEAHATGTALGDPIEVAALSEAYARLAGTRLPAGTCAIGSVKGNIGHLGPVAGLAGLIKTALALAREQLPPTINVSKPNPRLNLASTPFRVQDRLAAWPRDPQRPRRASVSSMGIGGTNVHVVLEEPPDQPYTAHTEQPRVVVWSGPTAEAERTVRDRLAESFVRHGELLFADTVATLQHGRAVHRVRAATVVTNAHDAAGALRAGRVVTGAEPRPVYLLFPGQGSQHVAMARGLYARVPAFARALDGWFDLLTCPDLPLRDRWAGDGDLTDTMVAQPLLFAVSSALAQLWQEAGVRPTALLGHSVGELVAATVAGIFTPDDAASLVLARARAMRDHPAGGGMLAVAAGEEAVADLLHGTVAVAAVNEPGQVVLSGSTEDLDKIAVVLAERGIAGTRLRTSDAFHTPLLRDAAADFARAFAGIVAKPPSIPVFSAATGHPISPEQAADPSFWARQLVEPVRFGDALDALLHTGDGIVLETGPGRVLTGLAGRHPRARDGRVDVVASLPHRAGAGADDVASVLTAAAHLWTAGHGLEWERLGQEPLRHRVPVPGYPYQRKRYWIDPPARTARQAAAVVTPELPSHEDQPVEEPSPFSTVRWERSVDVPVTVDRRGGTAVVFLPDDQGRALDIVLALQRSGVRTVRVRPAGEYRCAGDEFGVRPSAAGDVRRVFDELAGRGVRPDLLVYAVGAAVWSPTSTKNVQEQLDRSFFGLLAVVQHGLRPVATGALPGLLTLVTGAVDVSGADPVEPVKASLLGAVRTLAAEVPWLSCRLVDLSPNTPVEDLRDELGRADELVVALRGRTRWLPRERALRLVPLAQPPLRQHGVYVITGGLGGLGLETMRRLAATGTCPRIALLGRTVPAPGADDDQATRVASAVQDATSVGAQVRLIPCDVGEVRQVRRALDIVAAHFGPVNGVLHLAGVAGDGVLQLRRPELAAEVLRPKVQGTYALAEALAGRPALDFALLFSSRAAVDGLVGSGDYAAANAVLDLYARTTDLPAARVVSVDFPSWTTVGMASRPPVPPGTLRWETRLDAHTWTLAEHRVDGRPLLPGTGHLDLVVRAYRDTVPGDATLVVSDVAFAVPLYAGSGRLVHVDFTPDGDRHRWTVASRAVDDVGDTWVKHVTGRIERQQQRSGGTVDLAALRAATAPRPLPGASGRFTFGPRWQAVRSLRAAGDERVVEVRLPDAFCADLEVHPLHPALLDLATAAARDDTEASHVPFLYRRMTVFAPLPATFTSHVRRRPAADGLIVADVDLVDPQGRVLVRIEGFTMRQVDPSSFGDGDAAAPSDGTVGIDPAVGTDLVMALLSARTPEQVVVRPFRGGRPVPLGPTSTVEVSAAAPATMPVVVAPPPAVPALPAVAGTPVVERLRELWARTLGIDDIALDDDFFDLGGNSLSAIELMSQVREVFDVELTIGFLFEAPTLAELTDLLEQQAAGART